MMNLSIDVMTMGGTKFYRSLQYPFNPLFQFDMKQVKSWIMDRLPLLKYEKNIVLFVDFPPELAWKEEPAKFTLDSDTIIEFEYYARCNDKKRRGEMPDRKRKFRGLRPVGTVHL
jgi:hypothetical protein